ncbi:uncharacterized protein LOC131663035 [Phymastichus coffea]|uniref:uncharacterized protein LOC131663035 n=1 Tax=Phymastichus coffea TaxID=108790 RepID=UPI00273B26F6|nr:uncharacterized protein LOC131663035 [Phymastichus coffea]
MLTGRMAAAGQADQGFVLSCATLSIPRPATGHERLLGLVQKFWSLEEVPQARRISAADVECEAAFARGCSRDPTGRYTVALPLRPERVALLGESLSQARSALASMHRRMQRDQELSGRYHEFMAEYENLGHMRRLTAEELAAHQGPAVYIPHHGIWQRHDRGRKLRVVFNASRPTSSGYSLNDALHAGPKLQGHVATVLTRWRLHRYAFCADIQMMFRQIRVRPEDVHLQRVLWSQDADSPAHHYALQTVTYGEACAPYLALRTIRQLCADEGAENDLYMDDFLSGGHSLETTRRLRDQLIALLTAGGFHLRKWEASDPVLLEDIAVDDHLRPSWVHLSADGPVTELGVGWSPTTDRFRFKPPASPHPGLQLTKRKALAELSSIFDSAGWLAPITLVAKMIVQDLWRAMLSWDEILPQAWQDKWSAFRSTILAATEIDIPRWIRLAPDKNLQLHAFADASRRALAAAVYSRVTDKDGSVTTALLNARTKLSSIKSLQPASTGRLRMTIPRLELRAALIASQLFTTTASTLKSDEPVGNDLVDNYIAHVQKLVAGATLHHVPTTDNPADIASRVVGSDALKGHRLWWTGSKWLSSPESTWPQTALADDPPSIGPDDSTTACLVSLARRQSPAATEDQARNHLENFSTLGSLLRGTVRAHRLLTGSTPNSPRPLGPVRAADLRWAFLTCARLSQRQTFADEIKLLQGPAPRLQTSLSALEPFLDEDGLLRVGGRLSQSPLSYDERHPVLLDGCSHLAELVLRWAHACSLHGGFRSTYARVLQKSWITGGKLGVKRYLRQCLICARISARTTAQGMAPLPAVRVTPSRPFSHCGVDYAGPFPLCRSRGRGLPTIKGYVALFVCMSTKAIHLELVDDLTTASFLGALTRFIGRRGRPNEIWSDNGTNFRGASLELRRLLQEAEIDWGLVEGTLAQVGVSWRFIPPAAPHFGRLWEAGVKSMKAHLHRIAAPKKLTYEEFTTLLISIEATLNSRLLAPPTGDLDDLDALTPSHFLFGTSATSIPQPLPATTNLESTQHWELVRAMRGLFWDRWGREYLNTLRQRPKWRTIRPNLQVDDLVVITDPTLLRPDGRWPLGHIVATHPGPDGLVRSAKIRTAAGEYVRPVVKLAPLPALGLIEQPP